MSAWAKPGVKCVCIVDGWTDLQDGVHRVPMLDEVLTVQVVIDHDGGDKGLVFEEIPMEQGGRFCTWLSTAFRPLVTKSLREDVALFAHHLDCVGSLS